MVRISNKGNFVSNLENSFRLVGRDCGDIGNVIGCVPLVGIICSVAMKILKIEPFTYQNPVIISFSVVCLGFKTLQYLLNRQANKIHEKYKSHTTFTNQEAYYLGIVDFYKRQPISNKRR